jgi:hypothetical protein
VNSSLHPSISLLARPLNESVQTSEFAPRRRREAEITGSVVRRIGMQRFSFVGRDEVTDARRQHH